MHAALEFFGGLLALFAAYVLPAILIYKGSIRRTGEVSWGWVVASIFLNWLVFLAWLIWGPKSPPPGNAVFAPAQPSTALFPASSAYSGAVLPSSASSGARSMASHEPRWEYCELTYRYLDDGINWSGTPWRWEAEVVGPGGRYIALYSETFKGSDTVNDRRDVQVKMVNQLIASGWEPLPKGGDGQYRFQRRVA